MAVGIMTARIQASPLSLMLLSGFLQVLIQGQAVFQAPPTHDVFLRSKRANQFLLEEILQGNLERECHEELCNYEEAREYFESDERTNAFWTIYSDGDQCQPNPCLYGGNCTDKVGGFYCVCPTLHHGRTCELGALEDAEEPPTALLNLAVSECPTEGPTACHQLCTASDYSFKCSCLPGFKLQTDGRTCLPKVEFPCGQLPGKFNTPASMCPKGKCPWQVSLTTGSGVELCSGVVLGRRSILTAASCLFSHSEQESDLRPSNFFVLSDSNKMVVPVRALYIHKRYRRDHHDNDLVLLELAVPLSFGPALIHLCLPTRDFCENILMQSGRTGMASKQGLAEAEELVYMSLDECRSQLNVSHPLSNKMFCTNTPREPSGSPRERETATERGPRGEQNQTLESQSRAGAGNHISSKTQNPPSKDDGRSGSEVSRRGCDRWLTGTPVATAEKGTLFLTGLLMSSSAGCGSDGDGLVFTKLSRYLNWIQPRLEAAEDHMTPQVNLYPETH